MNDKDLRTEKRRAYWILRIAPVVVVLGVINLIIGWHTGLTVVFPAFSVVIIIMSVLLWCVVFFASRDARYRAR